MFSVTQLDINFSHIYLNKLDMLKMFFSHSKLENNSWFEELFNFLVIIAAAKLQLSKKCAFLMPKFDSIWKKHFWTQRADRTFIFVYLGKINFQRAFSYQLCLLVKKRVEFLRKIIRLHVYLAGQSGFTSFGVQNWPNCGQSKTRFFFIDCTHILVMDIHFYSFR